MALPLSITSYPILSKKYPLIEHKGEKKMTLVTWVNKSMLHTVCSHTEQFISWTHHMPFEPSYLFILCTQQILCLTTTTLQADVKCKCLMLGMLWQCLCFIGWPYITEGLGCENRVELPPPTTTSLLLLLESYNCLNWKGSLKAIQPNSPAMNWDTHS